MADPKPSTADILAQLRKQDGGGAAAPESAESSVEETAVAKPSSTADILAAARAGKGDGAAKPAGGGAKPSSTADILAAARSAKGGGAAKPAGGGAKPSSTADILAAARSGKGGGGSASSKAGVSKAGGGAKPLAAAKVAVGDRPSVAEMVKAAREGSPVEDKAASVKPKLPAKPVLPKKKAAANDSDRRGFLASAIVTLCTPYYFAWGVLAGIGGIWTLATARFMMPNVLVEPPTKFKIGPPSDYPAGTVSTKLKAERGIWVVHTSSYDGRDLIYALSTVCTHLGCTPNWLDGEQKFKCPCHGSGFYINGVNFEGPAPRPLERVGLRLAEDGTLEVDKSVKYQEELGQWQDPTSFVELS